MGGVCETQLAQHHTPTPGCPAGQSLWKSLRWGPLPLAPPSCHTVKGPGGRHRLSSSRQLVCVLVKGLDGMHRR